MRLRLLPLASFALLGSCRPPTPPIPGPTVTTTYKNRIGDTVAAEAVPFADPRPLAEQPRTPEGAFVLPPGSYEMDVKSYALSPGKSASGKVTGHVAAELEGPRGTILAKVLERASARTDVFQEETQQVIWALVTRARLDPGHPAMGVTTNYLLTEGELRQINSAAVEVFDEDQMARMHAKLPKEAREALEAQNKMRELIANPKSTYADMERVAVPPLGDEGPGVGVWTRSEDGYLIRFLPTGYRTVKVQLVVEPKPAEGEGAGGSPCTTVTIDNMVAAPDAPNRQRLLLATSRDPSVAKLREADGEKPIRAALTEIVTTCDRRVEAAAPAAECAERDLRKHECAQDLVNEANNPRVLGNVAYDRKRAPLPRPAVAAECRAPAPEEPPPPPGKGAKKPAARKPAPGECPGYLCADVVVTKAGAMLPARENVAYSYELSFPCGQTPAATDSPHRRKYSEVLRAEPVVITPIPAEPPPPPPPPTPAPTPAPTPP